MNRLWILIALALPLSAQEAFDFKALDKLNGNARESTNITLDQQTLGAAAGFLGADADSAALKSLIANLKGIRVRAWEFDKEGMYKPADIEPFRAWIETRQWTKIVDVREEKETSEVFMKTGDAGKLGGLAVIDAEPRELTIVYIEGAISAADLSKLSGTLDIPELDALKRGTPGSPKSNAGGKKEK